MSNTLPDVLKGIDWHANIDAAFAEAKPLKQIEDALMRIAQWSAQLESADQGNPALCFVREAQVAAQQCSALLGLCLYKAAAASARTMVETALYYSYFRTHVSELATLVRNEKYYVSKSEIMDYHKIHTVNFMTYQEVFGLIGNLEKWYSQISAVVHGQIPGAWNAHSALDEIAFSKEIYKLAMDFFVSGEVLFHQFMLCTAGHELWASFSPFAKTYLLKGLPGDKKILLNLDSK